MDERRKQFKLDNWEQYETIIKKALEAEDQAAQAVVQEVVTFLGISEQEF